MGANSIPPPVKPADFSVVENFISGTRTAMVTTPAGTPTTGPLKVQLDSGSTVQMNRPTAEGYAFALDAGRASTDAGRQEFRRVHPTGLNIPIAVLGDGGPLAPDLQIIKHAIAAAATLKTDKGRARHYKSVQQSLDGLRNNALMRANKLTNDCRLPTTGVAQDLAIVREARALAATVGIHESFYGTAYSLDTVEARMQAILDR